MVATPTRVGVALGAMSALGYSFTILAGRHLADEGLQAPTALGIRFGVGGLLLLALCAVRRAPLLPAPGERVSIFLLGAIGYMVESSFFFAALACGSAAAVTLIFYTYPALVTIAAAIRRRARPSNFVLGALLLSFTGSALIVAAGGDVQLSRLGLVFALLSSVTFAAYLIAGDYTAHHTNPMTTGAWVALGASASFLTRAVLTGGLDATAGHWPVLLGNGLANAVAFGAMFAALRRLGPSRTSVVLTLEAVFAVTLAALVLDEPLTALQILGAAAVLGAAIVIARAKPTEAVVASADAVHP